MAANSPLIEPPITKARRVRCVQGCEFPAIRSKNHAEMPRRRGRCAVAPLRPPIASRQPYNRPFTAAFGGSHGQRDIDRRSFVVGSAAAAATLATAPASAQDAYPSRPVTFVNPFPPGGAVDVVGRPFAAAIEPILKQPAVIETKAGAAGQVGAQFAASAKPDGYTLLAAHRRRFPASPRSTSCSDASRNSPATTSSRSRASPTGRWCSWSTTSSPTRR